MNRFPGFFQTQFHAFLSNIIFFDLQDLAQIFVRKAVFLSGDQHIIGRHTAFICQQGFFFLYQLQHLFDEPMLYFCQCVDLIYGCAFAQGFIHDEMTFTGRGYQHTKQVILRFAVKIFGMPQTIAAGFQRTDGFLEGFLVGFADTHDFAYGTHLGTQFVFYAFEFFESPAGEFDHDIITIGNIFIQSAVFAAGNIL